MAFYRTYAERHVLPALGGVHPKIVSERLGYADVSLTLLTYSHVLPGMQRESARRLDAMLFPRAARSGRPT